MAFKVPAAAERGEFDFEIGDELFAVPKINAVPIDQLNEIESSGPATMAFFGGDDPAQIKAIKGLTRDQFAALILAWYEDSEVTQGESRASES